jgi:prepilin-type N-terminal cleavage/methylation domain-containing protein
MGWPLKGKFKLFQEQRGFSLIELLVAVGILAAIGVVFMTSLGTAHRSVGVLDEQTQAEALARSQIEKIKDAPYQDSEGSGWYLNERIVDLPPQYSVSINVQDITPIPTLQENTLQEITVSVLRPANGGDRAIFSVKFYRTKK